jgi:hypothetical protein
MFTNKQLEEMSHMDIGYMAKSELVDAKDLKIDIRLPKPQRMEKYLEQIKNPYCFKCGETGVKVEFSDDAAPLQETLTKFLIRKKNS